MRALIVIDVQNDFCPGGALAVSAGDDIVEPINKILPHYDAIILTQDWHPSDHVSFAENQSALPFTSIELDYGPQVLWPAHCVIGSKGAEFHPGLKTETANLVLRKGFRSNIDSYSAFFENDKKTKTGLDGYLRARDIQELDFVGLATDFCVAWSAIDAAGLGYASRVILPLTRAIDADNSLATALENMTDAGVKIEENP